MRHQDEAQPDEDPGVYDAIDKGRVICSQILATYLSAILGTASRIKLSTGS